MTRHIRDESEQYHHDPAEGETHGHREPDDRDPHTELNTDADRLPPTAPGQAPNKEGMGGKPHARGERVAEEPVPPPDE
jgi:hypothetical protein